MSLSIKFLLHIVWKDFIDPKSTEKEAFEVFDAVDQHNFDLLHRLAAVLRGNGIKVNFDVDPGPFGKRTLLEVTSPIPGKKMELRLVKEQNRMSLNMCDLN